MEIKKNLKTWALAVIILKTCIVLVVLAVVMKTSGSGSNSGTTAVNDHQNHPAWLGIKVVEVDKNVAQTFQLPCRHGLLVTEVQEISPAKRSGLSEGDVILRMDGTKLRKVSQIESFLSQVVPGERMEILVNREGKRKILTLWPQQDPGRDFVRPAGCALGSSNEIFPCWHIGYP